MAGGFTHEPEGSDRFAKRLADLQAQLDALRSSSGVKNAELRGDVLTFTSPDGDLTARVGEFSGEFYDFPDWDNSDTIRGIQLSNAGDDEPFLHAARAVSADRIDLVVGFGGTALQIVYLQTGEFWVSGPSGSQFYLSPSGEAFVTAASGQALNLVGAPVELTGDLEVSADVIVGDDLRVQGDVGFYGTSPQGKPTVSGSRASGAALNDLLNELAGLGLITNSTSA